MARTKQTARKSTTGFIATNQFTLTSKTNRESLLNRWNKIYKRQDEESCANFGCIQRTTASSPPHSFQQQHLDQSVHLRSAFNDISTVPPHMQSKSTWPSNTINISNMSSKPSPKKTKKKQSRTCYSTDPCTINLGKRVKKTYSSNTVHSYKRRHQSSRSTGTQIARTMKEIKKYQNSTNLLLPKATFGRLVRQIAQEYKHDLRFTRIALEAIQQVTEWYMVGLLKDTNLCALHTHRIKIEPKDMQIANRLRQNKERQYTF